MQAKRQVQIKVLMHVRRQRGDLKVRDVARTNSTKERHPIPQNTPAQLAGLFPRGRQYCTQLQIPSRVRATQSLAHEGRAGYGSHNEILAS